MLGQVAGVVVSAGKMMKTVKVRVPRQVYNKHIRKHYQAPTNILVSDPNSSVREGDVVTISAGWRTSQHVRHVVTSIIVPFGPRIEERPPVPTEEQRFAARAAKREAKDERRAARRASIADDDRALAMKQEEKKDKPIKKGQTPQDVAQKAKRKTEKRVEKGVENEKELEKVEQRVEEKPRRKGKSVEVLGAADIKAKEEEAVTEEAPEQSLEQKTRDKSDAKDKERPPEDILGRVSNWWKS